MNLSFISGSELINKLPPCDSALIRIDYNAYIVINVILSLILYFSIKKGFTMPIFRETSIDFFEPESFTNSMVFFIVFFNIYLFALNFFLEPVTKLIVALP